MKSIVDKCREIVNGSETEFIGSVVGAEVPSGRADDCVLLAEAFAQAFPDSFVRAVGAYLHDCVEVG